MNKWEKELVGDTEKKKVVKQITEKVTDKTTGERSDESDMGKRKKQRGRHRERE